MVYLFLGQEQFLKRQMLQKLKSKVLGQSASGLNYDEFQAGEAELNRIIDSAKTAPFMSKFRLLVITDVNRLNLQEKEALSLFAANKPPTAVLALTADSISASDPVYKTAEKYGKLINFDALKPAELYKWVSDRFAHFKKKISSQAAKLLIDNTGNNLTNLNNAIELLAVFVGERPAVENSDVEALTGKDMEATAFQLVDAIAAKDASMALDVLSGLDKDAKTVNQTMGLIGWRLRRIWRNFPSRKLEKDFKLLLQADKQMKTKSVQPHRALELLAIRLCRGVD